MKDLKKCERQPVDAVLTPEVRNKRHPARAATPFDSLRCVWKMNTHSCTIPVVHIVTEHRRYLLHGESPRQRRHRRNISEVFDIPGCSHTC
jgi:hypothetical protein